MPSTAEVLEHHLVSFGKGDLDAVLSDYTEESVLFTPKGPLRGLAAIRPLFVSLLAEFGKPAVSFAMIAQHVVGEAAYIVWTAETTDNVYAVGTDTFIVRNGKIVIQSFAGKIDPKKK
jgi:ketosteroid isomerase-like protein